MDPFQIPLILFALAVVGSWLSATKHEDFLDEICSGLDCSFHRELRRSRLRYIARVRFQERNVLLCYAYNLWRLKGSKDEELEIAIPLIQKFWLRFLPRPPVHSGSANEPQIHVEIPEFLAIAHSNQPDAASEFLNLPDMASHWKELGPFQKLEIHRGMLRVLYRNPAGYFSAETLQATLSALSQLIFFYEEQPSFRILTLAANELCPFCRAKLDRIKESILQCRECGTCLHESCWRENGHCTTWGCASTEATPSDLRG